MRDMITVKDKLNFKENFETLKQLEFERQSHEERLLLISQQHTQRVLTRRDIIHKRNNFKRKILNIIKGLI